MVSQCIFSKIHPLVADFKYHFYLSGRTLCSVSPDPQLEPLLRMSYLPRPPTLSTKMTAQSTDGYAPEWLEVSIFVIRYIINSGKL